MKYSIERKEEYAILTLEEENLNSVKAPDLKSEFYLLKNMGISNIILNLEKVKFVDSSGLSAILTGNRLWTEDNQSFILTNINHPSVSMLINISRLDSILNISKSISEAEKTILISTLAQEVNSDKIDDDGDFVEED